MEPTRFDGFVLENFFRFVRHSREVYSEGVAPQQAIAANTIADRLQMNADIKHTYTNRESNSWATRDYIYWGNMKDEQEYRRTGMTHGCQDTFPTIFG